nr:hypothetical protein [uncultured Flavobacterium sp.]
MKTITINFQMFFFFLISNLIYSQDYIINDSIKVKERFYTFSHLSFGESNLTKYYKVMICSSTDYGKIKKEIINCAAKSKLEFSEFYILAIPNYKSINSCNDKQILMGLMSKIDSERMKLNLSTSLIKFRYDHTIDKFEYFVNQEQNNINDLENYKLNVKPKEVCYFLRN